MEKDICGSTALESFCLLATTGSVLNQPLMCATVMFDCSRKLGQHSFGIWREKTTVFPAENNSLITLENKKS